MRTTKSCKIFATIFILILFFSIIVSPLFNNQSKNVLAQTETRYGEQIYSVNTRASTLEYETVTYSTVSTETYNIYATYPKYHNTNSSLTNACAPVAGSNIVGFYDKIYDNFIPDYTVGFTRNGYFNYYPMTFNPSPKQNVINELYSLMGTNTPVAGTTQTQYKMGLSAYINSKEKDITYTSIVNNGEINFNSLDTQLRLGNPVTLFLSGYNVCDTADGGDGEFRISKLVYDTNHIMVCFGYNRYTFYDVNNNIISIKTFLVIAPGINGLVGEYLLYNNGTLNDAEAAYVY
jgi:hypothetical protein